MLTRLHIPKTLLWVIHLLVIYTLLFTLFRTITVLAFKPDSEHVSDLIPSFILGLRFDLRWIAIVLLPIIVAGLIPQFSPFFSARNKKIWTWYLAIMTFIVLFFFAADFGCFTYNKTRLGASALNFAEDPSISVMMLWQSYPIVWMVLGLVFAVILLRRMFQKLHNNVIRKANSTETSHKRNLFLAATFLMAFTIYGGFPGSLQWNAAFKLGDSFRSYLALNPLQNFFATLKLRNTEFDEGKAKKYFPVIAQWMNWQNANSYKRVVGLSDPFINTQPNVVLVMCESFSIYKSSMSGNPLNTTPYFKNLCKDGVFFDHCFTPHFSTARGLFATITGIPDVQLSKFSTRNPDALNQHTIINDFTNYNKFYFLGGDARFNNFEGLVKNIHDVNMITEGKFHSQSVNVWGISDKDLFAEANKTFAQQTKPFFAIVQTADNHRPFTIPEGDTDFQKQNPDVEELKKYGFESVEEFNAFRYFDYCVKNFIEAAKKEKYFDNTIFVFFGDHGVSGNAVNVYPAVWTEERLTEEHVPLLFYSPKLLSPQQKSQVVSQIDILPSIAGLTGKTYTNTTLGRDIFHDAGTNHSAFIILHDEGRIGVVTDNYYFTKNLNFDQEELHFINADPMLTKKQVDSVKAKMSELTTAYYETARWMLVHNK